MNFIQRYILYTQKHEAPEDFHTWTAMTICGAVVGRRCWIDRGFYKIFPGQMMVVLVGGSATVRKSTAAKIGISLVKQLNDRTPDGMRKPVEVLTGKSSPEAFLDSLMLGTSVDPMTHKVSPRDSHVLIFASELSAFLSKQAYTEALLPILTDLSDAPDAWAFRTRGRGEVALRNVCLGFLSASTPDWLAEAIPQNAFGGGFMSRIVFVYQASTPRRNPMPEKEDFETELEKDLVDHLRVIAGYQGPAKLSPTAVGFFKDWYHRYMNTPAAAQDGYFGRRADHMLRTAFIIAIGRGSPSLIDETDLEAADQLLIRVEAGMPEAFAQVGTTTVAREQERILRILQSGGGQMTLRELTRATWRKLDVTELTLALQTLKTAGFVVEDVKDGTPVYQVVRLPGTDGDSRLV